MADFRILPLWTDAYLADTGHLTPAENSAYLLLLIAAWRTPDCSLPNDDKLLGRMTRDPKNWSRVKSAVMAFWTLGDDGRWRQKRLTKERAFVESRSKKQSDNALTRWSRGQESSSPSEPDSSSHSEEHNQGGKRETLNAPNELTNNETDHATASLWHMPNACQTDASVHVPVPLSQESKKDPPAPLRGAAPPPTQGSNGHDKISGRGTRLPTDWQPDAQDIVYAQERGLDTAEITEAFRDWWHQQPGAKGIKLNWHATWRTWCRREADKRGGTAQPSRGGSRPVSVVAAFGRVLDRGKN